MPHEPKPLPTGNKLKDKRALKNYNRAHKNQTKYNKKNVDRAREIAHEGTYTSKRNLIPGFDGIKVMNSETTEQIPQKAGPYSFAQQEINNLGWVIENKNLSDQERSMLESAKLQLQNRMELGITQEQTWMNQIARSNDPNFFAGGTPDKEPDLSNYETFAEYRRRAGGNQDLTAPTNVTPPDEEVETETPKVESEFELKGGPLKSEAQARDEWLKKTRNSPAQQSGAWAGREEELWKLSRKSGANKGREFAEAIKKPEVKSEDLLNKMKKR